MILELIITAPEHAPLIEHYHEIFEEHQVYTVEWNYPEMPRSGESFTFDFIASLLAGQVRLELLPRSWSIMDLIWRKENDKVIPRFYVVGK